MTMQLSQDYNSMINHRKNKSKGVVSGKPKKRALRSTFKGTAVAKRLKRLKMQRLPLYVVIQKVLVPS